MSLNTFGTKSSMVIGDQRYEYFSLKKLPVELERYPYTIRVLLENVLRKEDGDFVGKEDIEALINWREWIGRELPFFPARVVLQDFTGVPCVVDFASMREALKRWGGDPSRINPVVRSDLVIDHSIQVDHYGIKRALELNKELEFARNRERYEFLRWAQRSLSNFRVVPPGRGIVHQVNLEYLSEVVLEEGGGLLPDTLIGTDSHTTMISGIGVFGFGVGGIEAEAVMLGQPYYMTIPEVVGVRLRGSLPAGVTATDLVLTITELLRREGVVGKVVEYCGEGLSSLSLPDRATLANMAPEYGATTGFFPVDEQTLEYLALTGREHLIERVRGYTQAQGLWREGDPEFSKVLELDLSSVAPSLAGPKRPQDRVDLVSLRDSFERSFQAEAGVLGFGKSAQQRGERALVVLDGEEVEIGHGSVLIAAITSCTNTSNPSVMLAAGLVAKKALERGLRPKPWVKTSLAPGSQVVVEYLEAAGLLEPLEAAGFHLVGYGCTTCIGNSGPLREELAEVVRERDLVVCGVLSGNRNFEGRIHPLVRANYLASPPLVVLFAFLGRVDVDLEREPIGLDGEGREVYWHELWPEAEEIREAMSSISPQMFQRRYSAVFEGDERWNGLEVEASELYPWRESSTYIKNPPYFEGVEREVAPVQSVEGARVLVFLGDSVTTDHISPAGSIPEDMPAGRYLKERGVLVKDFNSFGSRRGNHEVMMRGTFGNIRLKNQLVAGIEGGYTLLLPEGERTTVYEAAMEYRRRGTPVIVIGGREYGTGSSRDWAAKGTALLGVRVVLACSFERIHRNNLVGMGVLPLQFLEGESAQTLGLSGREVFDLDLSNITTPRARVSVRARREGGEVVEFEALSRLDTKVDVEYYRNGGILPFVLRRLVEDGGIS